jgi:hypothetical protein
VSRWQPQPFYEERGQAHPCRDGCQLEQARSLHASAKYMLDQAQRITGRTAEGEIVSQALWCDGGNHAFSARDLKAEHWERRIKDSDGNALTIPWDVCGACLAKMGPAQVTPAAAIED